MPMHDKEETFSYTASLGPKPVRFKGLVRMPTPTTVPRRIKFEAMRRHVFGIGRDQHGVSIENSEQRNLIRFRRA